jgi:preprotein translocase subunit SecG
MVIIDTLLKILHVFVCLVLMFVVLLQQGRGGGLGAAFGGGAASQVFGGRGAGNILTRATAICAAVFMLTSITLAYRSSSQDRALAARIELEKMRKAEKGAHKKDKPAPTTSAAPATTTAPTTATATTITMPTAATTDTAPASSGSTAP